ncbi:hypothetical protein RUM44_004106 [Polyplax serrata]|uniref:Uncharacterized protein n=1 Tax=Polyplax serrata TaxID=468196 RepID=A0ABR1B1W0_POLSC
MKEDRKLKQQTRNSYKVTEYTTNPQEEYGENVTGRDLVKLNNSEIRSIWKVRRMKKQRNSFQKVYEDM